MDRRSWTLLWVLGAIWGSSYMFVKVALDDVDSELIAWARCALAAIVLVPLAHSRGGLRGLGRYAVLLTLLAACQAAGPFLLIALGQQDIPSSLAGILVASTPLFTALLAIKFDQEERSQGLRLAGVVVGIVGVVVLLGLDLGGSGAALLGGLMVVLASLGYSIGGFMVKHRFREVQPIGVAAGVMVAGTVLLLPLALLHIPAAVPGVEETLSVVAVGVLGTGVGFAIFYSLVTTVGPARTFIVTYLAPGFAVVYGAVLLDEEIAVATIVGLALIVGGSYLAAEGRLPGSRKPPPVDVPPPPEGEAAAQLGIAPRPSASEAGRGR
jgi:drug/metabolite transporter (DMT)-like permease